MSQPFKPVLELAIVDATVMTSFDETEGLVDARVAVENDDELASGQALELAVAPPAPPDPAAKTTLPPHEALLAAAIATATATATNITEGPGALNLKDALMGRIIAQKPTMAALTLNHLAIVVADLTRAEAFYSGLL